MSVKPDQMLVALEPWINRHRRTAWRPEVRSDDASPAASAFSGIPHLRKGEEWPLCNSCGNPMEAMLQLDLATLPTDQYGTGLLQLFYCVSGECDGGWEPFTNACSLCRVVPPHETQRAPKNLNGFPAKSIHEWTAFSDLPSTAEHDRLGIRFDYHFKDVPFHPMELWCPELDLHFVGAEFIRCLESEVTAADGDKLGGWPVWVQGVEYPACPQCRTQMALVMQVASEDNVPHMFGDCGVGHITQCPNHHDVVAFGWACC